MMKMIKDAATAVADAIAPRPSLEQLTERLRTARAELNEARKLAPSEPDNLLGLPHSHMVEPSIACCRAAMKVRDAELAFRQGDSESDEIFAELADAISAKAGEALKLEAAVKAAQNALDAFDRGIEADVAKAEAAHRALNTRRQAEDLPGARALPHDYVRANLDFRSLIGSRALTKAAELLRRPVPGRDPSEGDPIQGRINDIVRGDTERETKRAVAAMPHWEDRNAWVAKWLSADGAGREAMAEKGPGARVRDWRQ